MRTITASFSFSKHHLRDGSILCTSLSSAPTSTCMPSASICTRAGVSLFVSNCEEASSPVKYERRMKANKKETKDTHPWQQQQHGYSSWGEAILAYGTGYGFRRWIFLWHAARRDLDFYLIISQGLHKVFWNEPLQLKFFCRLLTTHCFCQNFV